MYACCCPLSPHAGRSHGRALALALVLVRLLLYGLAVDLHHSCCGSHDVQWRWRPQGSWWQWAWRRRRRQWRPRTLIVGSNAQLVHVVLLFWLQLSTGFRFNQRQLLLLLLSVGDYYSTLLWVLRVKLVPAQLHGFREPLQLLSAMYLEPAAECVAPKSTPAVC